MSPELLPGIRLTDEQRAVVEHPLEPLRVVAGAGTGKTTTVVARIVGSVRAGMPVEAVLGLTFTNKAAAELGQRLRAALPAESDQGREVEVTTYHGFARRLLEEFGALVGVEREATLIGPGYVRQLLHESLDEGSYDHLDLAAPSWRVNEAATLARRLSDHLRSPADLLATRPPDPDDVEARRLELAAVIARYDRAKQRAGALDYGDLVRSAHELVSRHPEIRARVRARYRLLVLDEYQDTDPGQRTVLQTLFGDGFPVTAVGDEDQTIFEWRGASTANFRSFPDDFPRAAGNPAVTLGLTRNRRSAATIIDVANAVRGRLRPEGGFDLLRPVAGAGRGTVELRHFRTAAEEASWIADEVRRRHDEDSVRWSEIAVLFRKNRTIALVRDALEAAGVPVEVVSLGGLLDVPLVADLHAWLRVLGRPDDSAALARILLGSRYRLGFGDLAPLVRWIRAEGRGRSAEEGPGWPLVEAVDRLGEVGGLDAEARRRLDQFRSEYRELLVAAQAVSLAELCRRILDRTGAWRDVDALEDAPRLSARLNLYRFLDLAEEWSPLQGRPSLEAFLGYLDFLVEDRSSDELDTARVSGEDAVALLTVHRAKGLEWDTVFVPALAHSIFPASSLGFDNPLRSPTSVPYDLRLDAAVLPPLTGSRGRDDETMRAAHAAQEWRTAYVAVTRARRHLALSAASWYSPRRPLGPGALYELAAGVEGVVHDRPPADAGESPGVTGRPQPPAPDPLFASGWEAALRAAIGDPAAPEQRSGASRQAYDAAMRQIELMLDGLPDPASDARPAPAPELSVTNLVTLAQCPRRFEWTAIDPLPQRRSAARARGVALHRRIELHNRGQAPFEELRDDLYDAPESDEATEYEGGFAAFRASRYGTRRPRWTEAAIDLAVPAGRVRGRIDAIYEDGEDGWEIVDFKSGRRSSDPARRVQLQAYAVAVADGALGVAAPSEMSVSFVYLGGAMDVETEHVDAAWLEAARDDLQDLVASAQRDRYEPRPGAACAGCDFLRFCDEGAAHVADDRDLSPGRRPPR